MNKNRYCQSCGMPLVRDPQGGGSNADGTLSQKYCSYCYANGQFSLECSVEEYQDFCRKAMIQQGWSKPMAWLFTRNMKRLERWKNKQ